MRFCLRNVECRVSHYVYGEIGNSLGKSLQNFPPPTVRKESKMPQIRLKSLHQHKPQFFCLVIDKTP